MSKNPNEFADDEARGRYVDALKRELADNSVDARTKDIRAELARVTGAHKEKAVAPKATETA